MTKLPPLNALRTFEVAARHLSFTSAAEELHVTQAAVSHQIRTLEDWFGRPLFHRNGRQLSLTEDGAMLLPAMTGAMGQISTAVQQLTEGVDDGVLTVSTLYSLAANWLVPRLRRFRAAHPDIDVRVSTDDDFVDFRRQDMDMAIRHGRGGWEDVEAIPMMTEEIFPVCSPALKKEQPLRVPADLVNHTLIHDYHPIGWSEWLAAMGVDGVDVTRGPGYMSTSLVIQAAVEGQGVALGRAALVADDLAAGRLVKPFDLALADEFTYYVVYPPGADRKRKVRLFRDWLLSEAADSPGGSTHFTGAARRVATQSPVPTEASTGKTPYNKGGGA